ncbi:segregation/condensation protein A [Candidatus Woesearchaeota archaeon]|nr:segregation/condensation protein A [Candidatus Woesearchaeota archaeon]
MEDRIFQLVVEQNDLGWKQIIYDLVNSESMDPWDVNISLLTQRYVERLNKLRASDLKVSGKVLLAASLLLRLKSYKLVSDDVEAFDRLLAGTSIDENEFYDELEQELSRGEVSALHENVELLPRLPQPRKRKISVYELVRALEKALEVKKRRLWNTVTPVGIQMPDRKWDIGEAIKSVYARVCSFLSGKADIFFSRLLRSQTKEEKIRTFIPLLHLSNQRKVELSQDVPFGDIKISLVKGVVSNAVQN